MESIWIAEATRIYHGLHQFGQKNGFWPVPIEKAGTAPEFQKLINRYNDFYSLDLFGETIEGHRNVNPYDTLVEEKVMLNKHVDEDKEILSKMSTVKGFEDLEEIE